MEELKNKSVLIVGAGVAGLSTSYYLAKAGVKVKVLDYQPYEKNLYSPSNGCDAASADVNKIFRAAYGEEIEYQRLAYKARDIWSQWNVDIASADPSSLPPGIPPTTQLFYPAGFLRVPLQPYWPLSKKELTGLANIHAESPALRAKNYVLSNPEEVQKAREEGWGRQLDAWKHWKGDGVLDATAGFVRADKACVWMRGLGEKAGVEFVLGEEGRVRKVLEEGEGEEKKAVGVETVDGKVHKADLVIVACGGWTPSLLPQVKDTLEATGGSVITIQLPPKSERPDLWERYAPENYAVVSRGANDGSGPLGSCYAFPRTDDGLIKVGWRGIKWTNYAPHPLDSNLRISSPLTAYTTPSTTPNQQPLQTLPTTALTIIKDFIRTMLPDLVDGAKIVDTRMCWYCDSLDNNFLIDYVPGFGKSLVVCSGGSGHMFKFLPILGSKVIDVLTGTETEYTKLWKWPSSEKLQKGKTNGLEEGELGPRVLKKVVLAAKEEWALDG